MSFENWQKFVAETQASLQADKAQDARQRRRGSRQRGQTHHPTPPTQAAGTPTTPHAEKI